MSLYVDKYFFCLCTVNNLRFLDAKVVNEVERAGIKAYYEARDAALAGAVEDGPA